MTSPQDHAHDRLTVLVTGATGRQGGAVARALLGGGHHVRAMARRPGPAIDALAAMGAVPVLADLDEPHTLDGAVQGVDALFAVQTFTGPDGVAGEERQGRNLADAAVRGDVAHVVYSSVGAADAAGSVPHFASKARIERVFRETDLSLTVIRPAFFMDNFSEFAVTVDDEGVLDVALPLPPDRTLQMVATHDIGLVALAALNDRREFVGRTVELSGDELTGPEIATVLGQHLGRTARYTPLPLDVVAAHSAEMGAMFGFLAEHGYRADIDSLRTRFPALHSLGDWVREGDFTVEAGSR